MGELIHLPRNNETPEELKPKTLNEHIEEIFKKKDRVSQILSNEIIFEMSEKNLLEAIKYFIIKKLIEKKALSERLFPCGDYVSLLAYKLMMGQFDFSKHTQDFLEGENLDFIGAGDINLAKYILKMHRRRKDPSTAKDYMFRATQMYYNAYSNRQMELGYVLANELETFDSLVNMQDIFGSMFARRGLSIV